MTARKPYSSSPRKAARTTHISGYALPSFSKEFWKDIEDVGKIKLTKDNRKALADVITSYSEALLSLRDGSLRARQLSNQGNKKKSEIRRLSDAMAEVVRAWRDADQDATSSHMLSDFHAQISTRSKGRLNLNETMVNFETLAFSLSLHLKEIQQSVSDVTRPTSPSASSENVSDPFTDYINDLADILRACGLKTSKTISAYSDSEPHSLVKIVDLINRQLPAESAEKIHSHQALAKKVQRHLKQ